MANQAPVSFLTVIVRALGLSVGYLAGKFSIYTVGDGERAVIYDSFRGVLDDTVGEGIHFVIPLLQMPFVFDISTRPHTFSSVSGTKDLQMVNLTLRVLSRPEVSRLPEIVKTLGLKYDEKVLPFIGNEVLKSVFAQFNADQLHAERPHVSALVRERLIKRAKDFNIVFDDVEITHLSVVAQLNADQLHTERPHVSALVRERLIKRAKDFNIVLDDVVITHLSSRAVEQKQVARWKLVAAKTERERWAAIIRAQGESEFAKLISVYLELFEREDELLKQRRWHFGNGH